MADQELLKILCNDGVTAWNTLVEKLRREDGSWKPDFVDAAISGTHLADANLSTANFLRADLSQTDLSVANLLRANLSYANLSRSDLSYADLSKANLSYADLSYADLRHADLSYSDFSHAKLKGTLLSQAILDSTRFGAADFQGAIGLLSCYHSGPSTIGTDALTRSRGQIPSEFLRGCGLSDWEIESAKLYDPNLDEDERTTILYEISRLQGQQPIAMQRVFISYSHADEPFVEALEQRFDSKGVRYWRDVHDLKAGRIEKQIDRAITLNPRVLLVLSEHSVLSDWVQWEATKARELERQHRVDGEPQDVLCPIALDNAWKRCDWPGRLRAQIMEYNILDFSNWQEDAAMDVAFGKLYEGLILHY